MTSIYCGTRRVFHKSASQFTRCYINSGGLGYFICDFLITGLELENFLYGKFVLCKEFSNCCAIIEACLMRVYSVRLGSFGWAILVFDFWFFSLLLVIQFIVVSSSKFVYRWTGRTQKSWNGSNNFNAGVYFRSTALT